MWAWSRAMPPGGYASTTPPGASATADGQITTLYTDAGGAWKALALPYTDLQSLTVVPNSVTDIWAIGLYVVTTQVPNHNGAPSYASIGHNVLPHFAALQRWRPDRVRALIQGIFDARLLGNRAADSAPADDG